jgi:hypothetical protein
MRLNRTFAASCLLIGATLTGCSTAPTPVTLIDFQPIPLEEAAPELAVALRGAGAPTFVSLGAGDALGRAVYVNNIILAARLKTENLGSAVADVPEDDQ